MKKLYRQRINSIVLVALLTSTVSFAQGSFIKESVTNSANNNALERSIMHQLAKNKHFDPEMIETEAEDQEMQDFSPEKLSTEQLQKMLAELTGQDAALKAAVAAPLQSIAQASTETKVQTKEELKAHQENTRNEGLTVKPYLKSKIQITLEIDEDGSSKEFNSEGASTIKDDEEFNKLQKKLKESRAKDKNKIDEGGFMIELVKPQDLQDKISVVVMPDTASEKSMVVQQFDSTNDAEAKGASEATAAVLGSETGSTIINDKKKEDKENVIVNGQSDSVKYNSYVSTGYSIRNNLIQKMAPGDSQFHTVNYQPNNQVNGYRSFPTRGTAQKHYEELGDMPKLLISGETGDVLMAQGTQIEKDECLGNFYTQREYLKFYGQN